MLPAIEIMRFDIEQLFVEFVERAASETGFPRAGRADEQSILRRIVIDNGLEGGSEPVHLFVSMDDFAGDESVLQYPRVPYHIEVLQPGVT